MIGGCCLALLGPGLRHRPKRPITPPRNEADWFAPDFRFHTGEVMPALRLHYTTIGNPDNPPVLILHGTGQSGAAMLTPVFAGDLFGPGQPLDADPVLHHPARRAGCRPLGQAIRRHADEVPRLQL